jgi:hypothetical protein
MKKSLLILVATALLITFFPGAAKAASGDTTIYPITCVTSGRVNVYLDYGVNAITITNPNACHTSERFTISEGAGATWTQTIGGTTTSGSYDPTARPNFETGAIGVADSFTLTLTSAGTPTLTFSNGYRTNDVFFNTRFNTLTPSPVAIGEQVTVSGNNLSSVTSLTFYDANYDGFTITTANRTATQLTFVVPSTVLDWWGATISVTPGIYRLSSVLSKTLTITAAPVVVPVSSEELARQAAAVAAAQREVERRSARNTISIDFKNYVDTNLSFFRQAEIAGITAENIGAVQAEITALPMHSSGDIAGILKIARKYEVVGMIASGRIASIQAKDLIEIGLIPEGSKNKAALLAVVKKLSASERSSYAAIKAAADAKMAEIQARKDRAATLKALIASRRPG